MRASGADLGSSSEGEGCDWISVGGCRLVAAEEASRRAEEARDADEELEEEREAEERATRRREEGPAASLPPAAIDVTMALNYFTEDGALHLAGGIPKSSLVGFADPCPGEAKRLRVAYVYRGAPFETTVSDTDSLDLPAQADAVEPTSNKGRAILALLAGLQQPRQVNSSTGY